MFELVFITCAQIATLNKKKVYDVPASLAAKLTERQREEARRCAHKHGIRYRIVRTD